MRQQSVLPPKGNSELENFDTLVLSSAQEHYSKEPQPFEIDCIQRDEYASAYYQQYGAGCYEHIFAIANILSERSKPYEAACLYGLGYRIHSKKKHQLPAAEVFLQRRLLCFLKAGKELPEYEVQELGADCPPYAQYIQTMHDTWRGKADLQTALRHMGNAFENFLSGEEIDRLYLEQAKQLHPSLFNSDKAQYAHVGNIPAKLFLYWNTDPSDSLLENIYFHQAIPDLDVQFFKKESAAEWLYDFYGSEAKTVFLSLQHNKQEADFFRLHCLALCGGWSLDATYRISGERGLNFMLQEHCDVALFLNQKSVVHSEFYGATVQSSFMQQCLRILYENCYRHKELYGPFKTGAGVLNRALSRMAHRALEGIQPEECLKLYGPERFHDVVNKEEI